MFCDRCQDILNLDILLSALGGHLDHDGSNQRCPHHKNFADLQASAEAGCAICSLVCADPCSSSIINGSQTGQIYFSLYPSDLLFFDVDNLHETGNSFDGIIAVLRVSANEGTCICYKA